MSNFDTIYCSLEDCKKRFNEVDKMTLEELEHFSTQCANCGSWYIKDKKVLNDTCSKVCTKFAEKYNEILISKFK